MCGGVAVVSNILHPSYAGLRHWLLQRITAVLMLLCLLAITALLLHQQPTSYPAWRALWSLAWVRLVTLLLLGSLLLHAWLGVRDILDDYVPSRRVKIALQRLAGTALLLEAAWSCCIVWSA